MSIKTCDVEKKISLVRDVKEVKEIFEEVLENYAVFKDFKLEANSSSIDVFFCNEMVSCITYLISPSVPITNLEINTPLGALNSSIFLTNEDNFIKYISYLKFNNRAK